MFKNILCMTALAAVVAPAFSAEWMTDFEAAKAKAAQENKALLVDFTGSDWCGYCIKLRKQVLDTPAFEEYAADKFVLMEVDVPRKKKLDPALMQQNQTLCAQYNIEGFPTIMVMTPEGKVMGGFGGFRPDVESAKAPLDAALANMELFKQAQAVEGDEKARMLMQVFTALPEDMQDASGLFELVVEADTNNVTGIKDIAQDRIQAKQIEARLRAIGNNPEKLIAAIKKEMETATPANKARLQELLANLEEMMQMQRVQAAFQESPAKALAVIEELLQTATPEQKSGLLQAKFELQLLLSETEEDLANAKATFNELLALIPDCPEKLSFQAAVEKDFADPAAFLAQLKEERDNLAKAKSQGKAKPATPVQPAQGGKY